MHWFERWNKNWQKGKNDGEEVDFNQDYWNKADKALREYVLTTTQNTSRYPESTRAGAPDQAFRTSQVRVCR